jgi:hypothetical protein
MKHLTRGELIDLVEDRLRADRAGHAADCGHCRAEADALRATLALASSDAVPEPSPLFWDHFSARVADAIRDETPGADRLASGAWLRSPVTGWAAAASLSLLVMVSVVWRATLHAPAPVAPPADSSVRAAVGSPATDDLEADAAWAVVRRAAEGFEWDDARAAGISAHPGSAERIALELSPDERSELARLLEREMTPLRGDDLTRLRNDELPRLRGREMQDGV